MSPVAAAHAYVDRYMVAVVRTTTRLGNPPTCHRGCFHCCKEPVMAERSEAVGLVDTLTDPAARAEVTARTAAWWEMFWGAQLDEAPVSWEQDGTELARYRAQKIWCPFLHGTECRAYAVRPISCRVHLAIRHPSRCADDAARTHQKFVLTAQEPEIMVRAASLMTGDAPGLLQFDHLGVWLAHVLLGKTERSQAAVDLSITGPEPAAPVSSEK